MFNDFIEELKRKKANKSYEGKRNYLRNKGVKIGKNTRLNCGVQCFSSEPYLISIGDDCLIAAGVRFITHDGGVKVLNDLNYFDGKRMDIIGKISVGNNVYIGTNAYIMPGVEIGDNCVIGAGAIVTKNIPSNSLAVGVPAKVIKTVDEYYRSSIRKGNLLETAKMNAAEKKAYLMKKFSL